MVVWGPSLPAEQPQILTIQMKHSPALLVAAALAAAWSLSAADVDTSKLPPPAAKKGLTYEKDIRPIFEKSCFRCHGEERQKGELRLDSRDAVLKGGEDGKVVIPGKSEKSLLVIAVARLDEETAMPPKPKPGRGGPGGPRPGGNQGGNRPGGGNRPNRPAGGGGPGGGFPGGPMPQPLTAEQVGLIRAWVDQGAK